MHLGAVAVAVDLYGGHCLLLHADAGRSSVVGEYFLRLGGLCAAAAIDAVEALSICAGVVVNFEFVGPADFQLMRDSAGRDAGRESFWTLPGVCGAIRNNGPTT